MLIKERFNEAGAVCRKLVRIRVIFLQGAFIMPAGMWGGSGSDSGATLQAFSCRRAVHLRVPLSDLRAGLKSSGIWKCEERSGFSFF